MAILIDGYNFLGASGVFPKGSPTFANARRALLDYLAGRLTADEAAKTTIVFDAANAPPGLAREFVYRQMKIVFAPKDRAADDAIEELIRADSAPKRLTVVSSDHRIQRAAKRRKARAIDSEDFRLELAQRRRESKPGANNDQPKPEKPLDDDTGHWIAAFSDDDERKADDDSLSPFPPEFFT